MPAGEVAPIEQIDRLAPFGMDGRIKCRRALACPRPTRSIRSAGRAAERFPPQSACEHQIGLAPFLLFGRNELYLIVSDRNGRQRPRVSPASDEPSFPNTVVTTEVNP